MPESQFARAVRADAIGQVGSYIESLPGSRELNKREISEYTNRNFEIGWSIRVECSGVPHVFRVLLEKEFPFSAPRIALSDSTEFLRWPHVERDGVLCLLPKNATISATRPVDVLKSLLADSVQLVEDSISGKSLPDFEAEFQTYWDYQVSKDSKDCLSLIALDAPGDRRIKLWKGKEFDVIGDSDAQISQWMANRYNRSYRDDQFHDAALLWVPSLPHPEHYPQKSADAFRLLQSNREVLDRLVGEQSRNLHLIIAGTSNVAGTALGGMTVSFSVRKDITGSKRERLTRGFRPGHIPKSILVTRYFQSDDPVTRFNIRRVDHKWIHGRDRDAAQSRLRKARVMVIGCGSLGSAVAHQLAQSGVGELLLVDPDNMAWPNISRHALGAVHVGENKAGALSGVLKQNFPHLTLSSCSKSARSALEESVVASNADLIVNVTGDWGASAFLNGYQREVEHRPAVIYGWMESKAAAGHAVLIGKEHCIQCGFDDVGAPKIRITHWPESDMAQEPECGAVFESYGATEVAHSASLVVTLSLELLNGTVTAPVHRIWIGASSYLKNAGGDWSEYWRAHPEFREKGSLFVEQPWAASPDCRSCPSSPA